MLLFFAMVLVAVFVNRNLVFEQRSAANQYRSTQAFEAAEAGLEWAQAQLNNARRIGADCEPAADPTAVSFRARYLTFVRDSASFTPATWSPSGVPTALQSACVKAAAGWSCSCPANGLPVLPAPAGASAAPAFVLQFLPASRPGVVRLQSIGCTSLAGACQPGAGTTADATAKVEIALGLVGAMPAPPAATLTTRGAFDADAAPLGIHNPDPATAIAVHAGGSVAAAQARLSGPAGAGAAGLVVDGDSALAAMAPDRFFASYFGVDKAAWRQQPGVTRLSCAGDCSAALTAAVASAADAAMVWVEGDLTLSGPLTLGSAQRPVLIVSSGAARLDGSVVLNGALYAASLRWDHTAGGAVLRGAALSESGYLGDGAPELVYDAAILAILKADAGSFARVSGSWRDF
jgi:hypothetical protein